MRRLVALIIALVGIAACGDAPQATNGPSSPPPEPPRPSDVSPEKWIDTFFAPDWFPSMSEVASRNPTFGMADEDSEEGEAPPPPSAGGAPASAEEPDRSPMFGRATEGVAAFGGAGEEEYESESANAARGGRVVNWKRSEQAEGACKLTIGDDEFLPLDAYQATVRIDGFRARVVLDLQYTNTFDQPLEGSFKLRLPDEASVHYLAFGDTVAEAPLLIDLPQQAIPALDFSPSTLRAARGTQDVFREARIVPREAAQRAYAAETANSVDPALMEWNGAGIFSTRVFPLLPGKRSRITIAYDVDLTPVAGGLEFALSVPSSVEATRVVVQQSIDGIDDALSSDASPVTAADITVTHATFTWDDVAGQRVGVVIPASNGMTLTGDDPALGPHFASVITPDVPATEATPSRRAIFLLDVSMSANPDRVNTWIELMRATLERNRPELQEFAVLFFNVETWWWRGQFAQNDPATVAALVEDARRLAVEGATDLGAALREAGAPAWASGRLDADLFLLSDGAETWGVELARTVARGLAAPVFAYASPFAGSDTRALEALARETGGAVFSVSSDDEIRAAAVAHRSRPWTLRSVEVAGCSDILIAGRPFALFPGQRLRIAGRGRPQAGDEIVLTLEQDGQTRTVRVPLDSPTPSALAARTYGEIATGTLESLEPVASDDARSYALHYRVTGTTCSLLMLEDDEAYARYEIVPADEAENVRRRPVEAVVAEHAAAAERGRADARTRFLAWLDRLERVSGVTFEDLDTVRGAAVRLPASAFDIDAAPLACATRSWDDVSDAYRSVLTIEKITYDAAQDEALGRASVRGVSDGIRALSSLVEADPGSSALLRDVAFTMLDWDRPAQAYGLLRRVANARPHEPETYRAMAECLVRLDKIDAALLMYEIAVRGEWSERFGAFRLIAAMDYLRLLRRIERGEVTTTLTNIADDARERIASKYLRALPELVVTLTWNTDRTDVDLHVIDPTGFECYYGVPRSPIGGGITDDVTQGYGPEMFVLGRAVSGAYIVKANYYGSDGLRTTLRSRCYATVIRYPGTDREQLSRTSFLLKEASDKYTILRFDWE